MKRRALLQLLAASALPPAALARRRNQTATEAVLVLLELRGGNDGLNTVIPWRDPLYRAARPQLAIDQPLPLADGLGLHPALAPLEPLWREGRLTFALGVGWFNPSRSHFKAMDQWATGTVSGTGPGWLARGLDARGLSSPLLALGTAGSASLEGGHNPALLMAGAQLRAGSAWLPDPALVNGNPILRRMLEMESVGTRELNRIRQGLRPLPRGVRRPDGALGRQLTLALRLIAGPRCPAVLALSQPGYDTHAGQKDRHADRLEQLATALRSFEEGLRRIRRRPRVLLLAVSEFGRRLRENSSGGTDHGSASVALLLGDPVGRALPHPWMGSYPSLSALDQRGDLLPNIHPDALYEQVLRSLWG